MNNAPTVSVIMPAYNAESTLMRAVLSVIHQTFTDWQKICESALCLLVLTKERLLLATKGFNSAKERTWHLLIVMIYGAPKNSTGS